MIHLQISNYTSTFSYLNGHTSQNIKPLDLARALVTVGRGSWTDVFNTGVYRIGELICKALAFSTIEHGNLILHDRFFKLNQSEKVTISYYFGQGLTKLYAEKFLGIKWLFHVDDYEDLINIETNGIAISKIIIGETNHNARKPDLIGIKKHNISHIFEAKGNSNGYNTGIMQHAINQVSQVKTYNGVPPETRSACYFDLSSIPIKGIIIDPVNDDKGIDLRLDEELAITRYYSFFIKNRDYFSNIIRYGDFEYLTIPVGVPNIFFGFDKRLLELSPYELLSEGLYSNYEFPQNETSGFREVSLGLDGIIIFNKA